ncbi:MAG: (2Fe-2S)-binding protein [Firmicutes bacterium]|nr:(2Fe-2S)-binding protein [Bacillota bacterium]
MVVSTEKLIDPEYVVCLCRHIKTAEVLSAIKEKHINCLRDLCEIIGVGDKCGGCREELSALLDYALANEEIN